MPEGLIMLLVTVKVVVRRFLAAKLRYGGRRIAYCHRLEDAIETHASDENSGHPSNDLLHIGR
jgi:hypothetical protein